MLSLAFQQSALLQSSALLAGSSLSDFQAIAGQIDNDLRLDVEAEQIAQDIEPHVTALTVDVETPEDLVTAHSLLTNITAGDIVAENNALRNALVGASSVISLFALRSQSSVEPSRTSRPVPSARVSTRSLSIAPVTVAGQENMVHCAVCEDANDSSNKFCKNCGFALMQVETISTKKANATMVFGDLSGFSRFAENTAPEEVFGIINDIQAGLAAQVLSLGGYVVGYWGDAIFAVFGMDKTREDDPEKAVRCAMHMQEFMRQRNERLPESQHIQLRLGINSGRIAKGVMGGGGQKILTVLGNAVNIAARLEPLAPTGGIAISRATMLRASHAFELELGGTTKVKNIKEPVEYHVVKGEKPGAIVGTRRGEEVRFLGRDKELKALQQRHHAVRESSRPLYLLLRGQREWVRAAWLRSSWLPYQVVGQTVLLPLVVKTCLLCAPIV